MKTVEVQTPPLPVERGGAMFIEVVFDAPDGEKYLILAPIGDGRQFASKVFERIVVPALLSVDVTKKSQALIDALQDEAANHGGLRTQSSLRLENQVRLAINQKARAAL
jgi:hypothetical protein